ncbi:MAG: DUF2029 domain-containing protein [Gammaproteobacteria bacterium]|nr:DUF2029 domain-containing protein [Gammaproteobacteria bacterium]
MSRLPGGGARTPGAGARTLVVLGLLELVLLTAAGWWPEAGVPFPRLALLAGAFAVYWGAASAALDGRVDIRLIWGFAILFRVVLLPCVPFLSDDIYRYLWDGHVQLAGINPYLYPPDAPELESIRTAWHARINNPSISTIYPPFAQLVFAAGALAGGSILALKVLWTLADLAACLLLAKIARRTGRSVPGTLVLFAWSPLLVVETAWSGHFESVGILLLVVLVFLALPARRAGSAANTWTMGAVLALATLTKFAPIVALPALIRRYGVRLAAACAVVLVLFHLPYLEAGSALWAGLATYAEHWRAYEGAFAVIEAVAPGPSAPRYLSGVLVLAVAGWATIRNLDAERALFWILGAGLLLSPTFHPWYALWILPFAALRRSRAWILLSGLAFVTYLGLGPYLETGEWPRPLWTVLLLWLPFYALLLWDARPRSEALQAADPQAPVAHGEEHQERDRGV